MNSLKATAGRRWFHHGEPRSRPAAVSSAVKKNQKSQKTHCFNLGRRKAELAVVLGG